MKEKGLNNTQKQEVAEICANAVMTALKELGIGKRTDAPTEPKVEFTKKDGTVKLVSKAQADAWTKYRDSALTKEEREQKLAQWADARKAYKPSKALVEAIRKDRASITRKVAVERYGFVGTKDDLKALKESICK